MSEKLKELIAKWRETHRDKMRNPPSGNYHTGRDAQLIACADELEAALADSVADSGNLRGKLPTAQQLGAEPIEADETSAEFDARAMVYQYTDREPGENGYVAAYELAEACYAAGRAASGGQRVTDDMVREAAKDAGSDADWPDLMANSLNRMLSDAAAAQELSEEQVRKVAQELFDALDCGGFRWEHSLSEMGKTSKAAVVEEILRRNALLRSKAGSK